LCFFAFMKTDPSQILKNNGIRIPAGKLVLILLKDCEEPVKVV